VVSAVESKATILVVDDEPDNRFALSHVLAELEQRVVEAASGEDALRYLLREECAVILLDANMPRLDGYATAELIRRRARSRHIPIIFVSAIDKDDEHIARAYAMGAVDYVFKPVDPVILRSKIAVLVDLYLKNEEVRRQAQLERMLQEENLRIRQEKLEAERQLRQIEERQTAIVRSLPIALYSARLTGRFSGPRFVSEGMAQAIGFPAARFVEDPDLWPERIHAEDRERVLGDVAAIQESGGMSAEYRWVCADGSHRWFLDRAVLIRDQDGHPQEIFGSCLDITDRRRIEQQLFQAQKMEAVGQLTGGIAHDFNNMLTVVIGNLDSLARALRGTGRNFGRAEMALTGALSCAELTRRLLAFARRQPLQPSPVHLGQMCRNVAKLLGRTLGERIRIDIKGEPGLWHVLADPAQVESSLINLAVNARDAMPDGGQLTIRTANVTEAAARALTHSGFEPADYVLIEVTDTGTGMTEEVMAKIFEPFFSTKDVGKGTGLGLSTVYGIVKQTGGFIYPESAPGRGTVFRVYLPRHIPVAAPEAEAAVAAEPAKPRDLTGTGVVLLVEDEDAVRSFAARALQTRGYTVHQASNGAEALEVWEEIGGKVDLVVSDVVMPEMDGPTMLKALREHDAALKIIFMSGYAEDAFKRNLDEKEEFGFLQKPFDLKQLAEAVKTALEG
jgi:PAS domain S-box-containing protein